VISSVAISLLVLTVEPSAELDLSAELAQPGERWSVDRIATRAVSTSPNVDAAVARLRAAREAAREAWADVLPRTRLQARYTRVGAIDNAPLVDLEIDVDASRTAASQVADPAAQTLWDAQIDQLAALGQTTIDVPRNQYALSARVEYPVTPLFLEILPAVRARESGADASALQADVARNDVALSAVETYLEHARARGAAAVARASVREAQRSLADARARLASGTGNRPDMLRFEARSAQAVGDRAEREADVTATWAALRTLLDLEGSGPLAFSEEITKATTNPFPSAKARDLVEIAHRERDELEATDQLVRARSRTVNARRGAVLPKLLVAGNLDYAQPNALFVPPNDDFEASWTLSALLEWSPDRAWAATRTTARADADLEEAIAQRERIRDAVQIEVSRAEARFRAAQASFRAAIRGRRAADEALAARRRGYELGLFDGTALVDAELDASRARLAVVDAGVDLRIRRARLRRAVGVHLWEARAASREDGAE